MNRKLSKTYSSHRLQGIKELFQKLPSKRNKVIIATKWIALIIFRLKFRNLGVIQLTKGSRSVRCRIVSYYNQICCRDGILRHRWTYLPRRCLKCIIPTKKGKPFWVWWVILQSAKINEPFLIFTYFFRCSQSRTISWGALMRLMRLIINSIIWICSAFHARILINATQQATYHEYCYSADIPFAINASTRICKANRYLASLAKKLVPQTL